MSYKNITSFLYEVIVESEVVQCIKRSLLKKKKKKKKKKVRKNIQKNTE